MGYGKLIKAMGIGAGLLAGCGAPGQDDLYMQEGDVTTHEIDSSNGLQSVNGLSSNNGLISNNGLMSNNGLSSNNGLASNNGLMTSTGGRKVVEYMTKCAVAAGQSFSKQDQYGTWYSYQGRLGFGSGWKDGACDQQCQEYVSACILAHLNSTGNQVPIWVTANPSKMPGVGFGLAYQSNKDMNIQEGVFMGNIMAMNPPQAFYAKGVGFKGSIPGRLGADSNLNPYKPLTGYRIDDHSTLYTGIAPPLCREDASGDGIHVDYTECETRDTAGNQTSYFGNVVTTYVNYNYSGTQTYGTTARTIDFEGVATGRATNSWDIKTIGGMDFYSHVDGYDQPVDVTDSNGSRRLCFANSSHVIMTKNGGEPFRFNSVAVRDQWTGSNGTVTIHVYQKGGARTAFTVTLVPGQNVVKGINMDNVIKVEFASPETQNVCLDDMTFQW